MDSAGGKMVGSTEMFVGLKDHLKRIIRPEDFGFFSFFGLAGSGRSVLAKSVYDDIESSFECRAWVKIGSTYQLKQILLNIISQIINDLLFVLPEEEEKWGECLYTRLEGKRYIVALDDIHDTDILIQLRRFLPEQNNGSLVFLTTSLMEVAEFDESFFRYEITGVGDEIMNWAYIRCIFFAENEAIPAEFEEAGKKIARNCRGLRLVLARVILVLRKAKRTIEFWGGLAAAQHDRIYQVEDEISETTTVEGYLVDDDQVWAKGLLDMTILRNRAKVEHLFPDRFFPKMGIMTIIGMAGVGKTTLMKNLFQDQSVLQRFDHCVWVNVGSKYKSENILVDILAQIYPYNIDIGCIKLDAELPTELSTELCKKKWLIVLDDLWSQEPVHYLKKILPNIKGELMVTSRLLKVALFGTWDRGVKMSLLNKEESWDLLREKVFGENLCSHQLAIAGKKIAHNCEGLPLFILAVADQLCKSEITLKYWNTVAENKLHVVMMDAHREISPTLLPSYKSLPQHLKACFLYMGVFPQSFEISASKLKKLWFVEGFLEPDPSQTVEDCASKYLWELLAGNVVMVRHKASYLGSYKSCSLHSVFWHLSCREAGMDKFFQVLNIDDDGGDDEMESKKRQRRLCIRNSILLGFNDMYDEKRSYSALRSLLCTGPPHQFPVPLHFGSRLLRVLDAPEVRLYEFLIEVVKLLHLRYLALTCNIRTLPPSISRLRNLQFLIVRQHLVIKSSTNDSYLPKEIWDMKELKHLQISGSKLPNPSRGDLLPNLSSLLEVNVHSCTKRVFKRIPNLKKLGIQIELAPDDKQGNHFDCLSHISYLRKLESLKCVVVNPDLGLEDVAPPIPRFPPSLKKLSLSGMGYPWEYMRVLGKLPNLEVLKLRCYAFHGPTLEIDILSFEKLNFLSIEDTDLVRWNGKIPISLQCLFMKHCYDLEHLPLYLTHCLDKLEIEDSSPSAMTWAKESKEKNWEMLRLQTLQIHVPSSWNDEGKLIK